MKERTFTYNNFLIEGKRIYREELTRLYREKEKDPSADPYEREIYAFILDFLSPQTTVRIRTSGSTGTARTLTVSKKRMINSARMTGDFLGLKAGDRALLCLPAKYIAGRMMIVRALVLGLDLWFTRPSSVPEISQDYDLSAMTPMQVAGLLKSGHDNHLKRIGNLLIGGGPLPSPLEDKLASFPHRIYHTYGMTETLSHIALRRINGTARSKWFTPLPGIRLLDGPQNTLVIYAPAITGRKALITHDIVRFSGKDTRQFRMVGRTDHIINSGGVKVVPEEIESLLEEKIPFPFFIGSTPDNMLGEKITLFVETTQLTDDQQNIIIKAIQTIPAPHHRPRLIIALYPFIFTGTGKIRRRQTMKKALQSGMVYNI